ncbi:hypothetical protein [Nonomuraea sp. NPDC049725]|uniref:hypothetical protein n=1 Tax=Nonomuraea sp. NPDC049725 TaxID=3154508 RepID=UPI003413D854
MTGIIPNTAAAYRKLSAHLAEARLRGNFPDLIDAVREIHSPSACTDRGEILAQVPDLYRRDRTEHQPVALHLAAERTRCGPRSPAGPSTTAIRARRCWPTSAMTTPAARRS